MYVRISALTHLRFKEGKSVQFKADSSCEIQRADVIWPDFGLSLTDDFHSLRLKKEVPLAFVVVRVHDVVDFYDERAGPREYLLITLADMFGHTKET